MRELTKTDLHFVVSRLPKDIRKLMKEDQSLMIGGGFLRATIAGEKVSDIDIFGKSEDSLTIVAQRIALERGGRVYKTDNAITVLAPPRIPLQFITRWLYEQPEDLIKSFDYTICQALIMVKDHKWFGLCSDMFYPDLAARRLNYTSPVRDEEVGGSMLRMRKFIKRGYSIQAENIAKVVSRLISKIDKEAIDINDEERTTHILKGLLFEVDPMILIDGIDMVDEHEIEGIA